MSSSEKWPVLLFVRKLDHGGCERDLSKVALGLDRNKFEPHVGCFRPEGLRVPELTEGGIPILKVPVTSFRSKSAIDGARVLRRYIREHGIRLIHSYDGPTALYITPLARAFGVPAVLTSQLCYRTLHNWHEHRMLRVTDRLAHKVVVNCEAMRRHMSEDEGLDRSRMHLCYNGVDTGVFYPRQVERPEALRGAVVIGTVANLREEKGLDVLLKAFAKLQREVAVPVKCYFVGSGPCEDELKALAASLGIADSCIFQPGKPDVTKELNYIDIFALPSRSEAFSNALLEAMASGCTVVGSNLGGTPEMIRDGETGLLFEPGSVDDLAAKLRLLVESPELRTRLREQAVALARNTFSIERNLACFSDLYESMITARSA
jgi:glycosyltransferase involved in cell wall biosynthesis